MFISNGWMCDVVVVVAVTNREAKVAAHGISLFLVENGTKGFQKGRKLEKIGLKAQVLELKGWGRSSIRGKATLILPSNYFVVTLLQDTAELFFEDVRLPADALIGEVNKGFYYLMNELPQVNYSMNPLTVHSNNNPITQTIA